MPRQGTQVHLLRAQLGARDACKVEQIIDQGGHPLRRLAHALQIILGRARQLRAIILEQRQAEAVDAAQRRAQIVRDGITEGFQLVIGRFQLHRPLTEGLVERLNASFRRFAFIDIDQRGAWTSRTGPAHHTRPWR